MCGIALHQEIDTLLLGQSVVLGDIEGGIHAQEDALVADPARVGDGLTQEVRHPFLAVLAATAELRVDAPALLAHHGMGWRESMHAHHVGTADAFFARAPVVVGRCIHIHAEMTRGAWR